MRWLRRLGRTLTNKTTDNAVQEELRRHVELETEDLIARGMAPAEARRRALMALGSVDVHRDDARRTRGIGWLDDLRRDAAYAVRSLVRAPGFSLVVLLTLALGIGANATFFSILNALVYRPLPVKDPDRLVIVEGEWTNPVWEQIRDRHTEFAEGVFAWGWSWDGFDVSGGGLKEPVDGAFVSGDLFRVLGVGTVRGRPLTVEDDRRGGGSAVAVISHRLWQERFGGDEEVIGRVLTVNRVPVRIVGVAEPSFFGLDVGRSFDLMLPFALKPALERNPRALDQRTAWWVSVGARLGPGQTLESAQAALRAIQASVREATLPEDFPPEALDDYMSAPFTLQPAATGVSALRSQYEDALTAVMVIATLVLLIACANIANLLLARATTRQRELSVRLAIGASRYRIAFQLLAESLTLATGGAVAGFFVANWASAALINGLSTWRETFVLDVTFDWRVFGFMVIVTALATVVFGLAPAWGLRTMAPQQALGGARGSTGDNRVSLRNSLVVMQVAMSLVLLVAAGLFLRTFVTLSQTPIGMDADRLLAVEIDMRETTGANDARQQLIDRMREAVAVVPGVSSAAASSVTPLSGRGWNTGIGDVFPPSLNRMSWVNAVTPGWFDTVGARLLEGRDFTNADGDDVLIVNETFARTYLEPGPAVGQTVGMVGPGGPGPRRRVIGLASDVMYRSPRDGMVPTILLPPADGLTASLVVRVAPGQHAQVARVLPMALRQVDPNVSFTLHSFEELARATTARERLTAVLAGAFGVLALVLAAVGLYGVMAFSVGRRRSEIAVRLALGAERTAILRLVVGAGGLLIATGVAAGAVVSWWAAQYVQSLLFGLEARDPVTVAAGALVLTVVGLAAAWIPAWRASRIDPAGLLRDG
jgi:putative ABC transport system permease protein